MASVMDFAISSGQIARQCPNGVMRDAVIRAARAFCKQTRWLRVQVATATVAGTRTYDMSANNTPEREIIGIRAIQATKTIGTTPYSWSLTNADATDFNPNVPAAEPKRYAYVPEAGFSLDPIPDRIYSMLVLVVVQPPLTTTTLDDRLEKWSNAIEFGTLGYLLSITGQPWTNPIEAERNRRAFQAEINNARADEQRGYNAGSVRMRTRRILL